MVYFLGVTYLWFGFGEAFGFEMHLISVYLHKIAMKKAYYFLFILPSKGGLGSVGISASQLKLFW